MKKTLALLVAATVCGSTSALAAGYGAAGCGLGSLVIGPQPGMVQVFASTTNGTSNSQTFGITSGTSNCGGGGAAPSTQAYIEANRTYLANDISRGKGETLDGLAQMMCCKSSVIGSVLQANYKTIFPSAATDAATIEASIKSVLKGSCS